MQNGLYIVLDESELFSTKCKPHSAIKVLYIVTSIVQKTL